jgi:hypothetical protein
MQSLCNFLHFSLSKKKKLKKSNAQCLVVACLRLETFSIQRFTGKMRITREGKWLWLYEK